jgi:hypothetical protein
MAKIRVLMFFLTCVVVGTLLYIGAMYARGYRYDKNQGKLSPRGLLVIKSNPDGAQVYIDDILKTATNSNLSLVPGKYDVSIRKDGFRTWEKTLTLEKEIVTEADATLFRSVPALSPITFSGASGPVQSDDLSKIIFTVPPTKENIDQDKEGLYIIETINLPIGFSRDPRRITDGDLTGATYEFSPDGRQVLLKTLLGTYLLDDGTFTPVIKRVGISLTVDKTVLNWKKERDTRVMSLLKNIPDRLALILTANATNIVFSPDETKILYKVTADASIPEGLIKPIPGASTQKEERDIKVGRTYIYDIKEDRNFLISETEVKIDNQPIPTASPSATAKKAIKVEKEKVLDVIRWYPTSKNIILSQSGKIIIMDIDGTNRQEIYSGSYTYPLAFPTANSDRIIILTNLGANTNPDNLYTLILK